MKPRRILARDKQLLRTIHARLQVLEHEQSAMSYKYDAIRAFYTGNDTASWGLLFFSEFMEQEGLEIQKLYLEELEKLLAS